MGSNGPYYHCNAMVKVTGQIINFTVLWIRIFFREDEKLFKLLNDSMMILEAIQLFF